MLGPVRGEILRRQHESERGRSSEPKPGWTGRRRNRACLRPTFSFLCRLITMDFCNAFPFVGIACQTCPFAYTLNRSYLLDIYCSQAFSFHALSMERMYYSPFSSKE